MGCDIHMHIEVKINGNWEHYAAPNISRNYELFAKLANVRNRGEVEPISDPIGLPEDMTALTALHAESWGCDGHSHSWLNLEGILELTDWLDAKGLGHDLEHNILGCSLFGNSFCGPLKYPEGNREGVEDVRFIFWFDN